jgi:predicted nucleic acid-binding protein
VKRVVYDTGVLIAAECGERQVWAEHRVLLETGLVPLVPAPVVAQASRTPRQAQLHRLLRGCEVVPLDEAAAHRAGALLGKSGTRDVVDASVAVSAIDHDANVVSDDARDIARLLAAARSRVKVRSL